MGPYSLSLSLSLSIFRLWWVTQNYFFEKTHHLRVRNSLFKNPKQGLVIDRSEESSYVALEREAWTRVVAAFRSEHSRYGFNAPMRALADSARKGVANKGWLEYWVKGGKDRMMEDAVAHTGLADIAEFWIGYAKAVISFMSVSSIGEFSVKLKDFLFKFLLELEYVNLVVLVFLETVPRQKQLFGR